jgi:hypothetical protein
MMMTKRNRNIKNIFNKLQFSTNIMANEVKTPNTKLFWKSVVWKFDILDSSLVVFRVLGGEKIVTSPCGLRE